MLDADRRTIGDVELAQMDEWLGMQTTTSKQLWIASDQTYKPQNSVASMEQC